jgi:hypothetical protein
MPVLQFPDHFRVGRPTGKWNDQASGLYQLPEVAIFSPGQWKSAGYAAAHRTRAMDRGKRP